MERRAFVVEVGKAFPVIAGAVYFIRCGGGDGGPTGGSPVIVATSTTVNGHQHTASVPEADTSSTADRTYESSLTLGHTHQVTLTAANFATLAAGGSVTVTSSSAEGHAHDFKF